MRAANIGDRVVFEAFGEPDPTARLVAGDEGVVTFIDDVGTVHVRWDNGLKLGMVMRPFPGGAAEVAGFKPDRFRVVDR